MGGRWLELKELKPVTLVGLGGALVHVVTKLIIVCLIRKWIHIPTLVILPRNV